ncbi:MAG: PEP-CTERM sorting domain-containing protein [Planctomycetota bacterium]
MIRSVLSVCALIGAILTCSVADAANVDLSLNLDFDTPGDLSSGGTWTAVATADENGLTGIVFLAENVNNDAVASGNSGFAVFESQQVGLVIEVVTGFDATGLLGQIFGVGVPGSSFPSTYVDPVGIAPLAGSPDLGSFTGGVELATGSFDPGAVPALLASSGTLSAGANIFDITGDVVFATLNLTVRTVIPEPATMLLLTVGVIGAAAVRRR